MFTINIYLKLALIAVLLIGGIALSIVYGFWYGFVFILAGVLLLVSYLLLGTVQSAAVLLQEGDLEAVDKRLALTVFPSLLFSANKAYYYMIKGTLAQQRNQKAEAEEYLKIAQEVKLPSDNERAMLELQLANIAATKNRMNQAKLHLRNAKKMNITEETIKDQLQQLEVAIKSYGASNTARMSGGKGQMRNPGGKRRRPKMR